MAAPLCYFSFLLMLCFLPCISFPYPKEPNCDSIGIQIPFFRDTSPPNSGGIYMIHCNNLPPTIQFNKKGQNYTVLDIDYHDKILRVRDPKLSHYFQGSDCSFLYVFKNPIPHFNLSLPYKSFFNCEREDYDFSRDCFTKIYNSKICKDYNLHYSYISSHQTPPGCLSHDLTLFEWELSFNESELSLLSASYSNNSYPTPDCLIQQISGDDCSSTGMKNSKKIVIGVAAGGAVLLAACCLFLFLYRRQKSKQHSPSSLLLPTNSSEPSPKKDPELGSVCCQTQTFSYKELEEATDGFDTAKELGDGGFGTVYKGELRDGRTVAVKRLYENNCKRVEQFMNEIVILSRLRHQNLVTLYGYSSRHSRELLLVYEFVPNGTVADHLHGSRVAEGTLTWPIRMNIAIETAEALAYLHAIEPQIIHRDVKTNNILLDNNFHVKVADFGLSRLFPVNATHVSTAPQGTPGYVDPEYHQCYQLTDKSDVYSFGVVLVELISSKPAVDVNRRRHEINLANMAINKIQNGELDQLIDLGLGYELNWEVKSMTTQVAELAFRCLQWDRDMRPPIKEVLEVLRAIRSGWHKTEKAAESDANTRNDTPLLKDALPYSPGSVTDNWVSTSTTSNTSS